MSVRSYGKEDPSTPGRRGCDESGRLRRQRGRGNADPAFHEIGGLSRDSGYRVQVRQSNRPGTNFLDVNPRIGATFRLFVDTAGLDVARTLYRDLTRQPVGARLPREGRKWVVENLEAIRSEAGRRCHRKMYCSIAPVMHTGRGAAPARPRAAAPRPRPDRPRVRGAARRRGARPRREHVRRAPQPPVRRRTANRRTRIS